MIRGYLRTLQNYLCTAKARHDLKGNVTLHPVGTHCDRSITENLRGYLRTLQNYLCTAKARHDLKDYACALAVILITTAIIMLVIRRCAL